MNPVHASTGHTHHLQLPQDCNNYSVRAMIYEFATHTSRTDALLAKGAASRAQAESSLEANRVSLKRSGDYLAGIRTDGLTIAWRSYVVSSPMKCGRQETTLPPSN